MAIATSTTLSAILKTLYPKGNLPKEHVYAQDPFVALVAKDSKFGGEAVKIPIQYRGGGNTGRTVAQAQASTAPAGYRAFTILAAQRTVRHAVAQWDRQAVRATMQGSDTAFVQAVKKEMDAQLYTLGRNLARDVWGDGGGTLGQVLSGVGTPTITLANPDDIVNFDEGQIVQAADSNPGVINTGNVRVGSATITAIDRSAGTLTISGNWTTAITSFTAGDFLFLQGDIDTNAFTVGGYGARGIASWVPQVAPGPTDSFYSVNRSVDATRLAGWRYNGQGQSIEEVIQIMAAYIKREGGLVDYCFLSPRNWYRLSMSASTRSVFDISTGKKDFPFGFSGFKVTTAAGDVTVVAGPNVKSDRLYLINKASWTLRSLDPVPSMVTDDGNDYLRLGNANTFEARMLYDMVLTCDMPGFNGVASLTPPTY